MSSIMLTRKWVIFWLLATFRLSNSQYKGVRRVFGINRGDIPSIQQQYRSSEGEQTFRVENWLHSYKDLLDQWVAPGTESEVFKPKTDDSQPKRIDHRTGKHDAEDSDYMDRAWDKTSTPPSVTTAATESFLMSFLGDIIPYFQSSGDSDSKDDSNEPDIGDQDPVKDSSDTVHGQYTNSNDDQEDELSNHLGLASDEDIYQDSPLYDNPFDFTEYGEPNEVGEMSRIKRLGLAEDSNYDSKHRLRTRKKLKKQRKIRRRSTTERNSQDEQNSPRPIYNKSPDFKRFCRQVIRTIADNVQEQNFQKVTMYQEIWYLISKYNIPVEDHDVDIVILIDDLCKDDEHLAKEVNGMDNQIEVDEMVVPYSSPNKKDFPFLDSFGPKSEYSSVAKFPQFHQEPHKNPQKPKKTIKAVQPPPYVPYSQEKFPPGFDQQDYLFYPTQIQPETKQHTAINHENDSQTENPIKVSYPQVTSYTPRQQETERYRPQLDAPDQPAQLPFIETPEKIQKVDDMDVITLYPELDISSLKKPGYQFLDNEPQDILVASSLSFGDNAQNIVLTKGKVDNVDNHRTLDQLSKTAPSIKQNTKEVLRVEKDIRKFTPSQLVSSTFRPPIRMASSTYEPPLRRGTVESIPRPRPTFPPIVKTSKLDLENEIHPNYLDSLPKIPPSPDAITEDPQISGLSSTTISTPTFKTSKLERNNPHVNPDNVREKYYTDLQNKLDKLFEIEDQYEQPSRSSEENPDEVYIKNSFSPQYASAPGYFPQQREPYPYKNFPLPYLTPPDPIQFRPKKPLQRANPRISSRKEFDREDIMSNKMDDMKYIDGYVDTSSLPRIDRKSDYPLNVYRKYFNGPKPQNKLEKRERVANNVVTPRAKPTTKPPALKALTLHQLSMGLSTEKQVPPTVPGRVVRNYTLFDMADAVAVSHSPPPANAQDLRLRNHIINKEQKIAHQNSNSVRQDERPPFRPYNGEYEVKSSTPRSFFSPDEITPMAYAREQDYNTLRPDYIEYDQSPEPSRNHDDKLMVDLSSDRPKRNVSIDDLLFLYNITFLTDHEEITPSNGNRRQQDHNIDISMFPDSIFKPKEEEEDEEAKDDTFFEDYEDELPEYGTLPNYGENPLELSDYSSLPLGLPDYQALNSEDKFSDALDEFLKEYDTFSKPAEDLKSDEEVPLQKIMSDIAVGSNINSFPKEIIDYSDEYEYEYDELEEEDIENETESEIPSWPGHHVNHRTHSVPEFANQLISQQREGSGQRSRTTTTPLPMPGFINTLPRAKLPDVESTTEPKLDANLYKNHKPFFTSSEAQYENDNPNINNGIKEVLMVLNGTGKSPSKDRTKHFEVSKAQEKESREGYYPERKSEFDDIDVSIDNDIDKLEGSLGQINDVEKTLTMNLDNISHSSEANNESNNNIKLSQNHHSTTYANDKSDNELDVDDEAVIKSIKDDITDNRDNAFFYPIPENEEDPEQEATTESLLDVYENLSNMIDSWDADSNDVENSDKFIDEIIEEKGDSSQLDLLEEYDSNSLYEDSTEDFPLKSFMTEPNPNMIRNDANISKVDDAGLNPEKLAYILIGVCCGLSIFCLIVVAVSIGYKSETHYRLEEPRRKHIRLLKANNSDEDSSSNTSEQDDKSRAKLGNWFTGKHTIQTMERKSNLVFPTSVYLENLASSATHSELSRSNSSRSQSPSVGSENHVNLFEVEAQNCDSGDYNEGSLSSISSIKTDPNLVHHDSDSIEANSDDANKKKKAYKSAIGGKNKSSYAVSSSKFSKGEQNLSQIGLPEGQERFRFISQTPTGRRNSNATMGSNHENIKDSSEITWSQNPDRLI